MRQMIVASAWWETKSSASPAPKQSSSNQPNKIKNRNLISVILIEFLYEYSKGYKLIILDEADAMTNDAQNALRRVLEKYTENVRFCIICNYLSKIIPAIQSRCTRFRFGPLGEEKMSSRLMEIVDNEKCGILFVKVVNTNLIFWPLWIQGRHHRRRPEGTCSFILWWHETIA